MDKAKGAPGNQYTGKLNPSLYLRGPKAARTIRAFERGDETGLPPRDRPMDCPLFPEMHAVSVHADDGRVDHLNGGIMAAASASMIRLQTPALRQRRNRLCKWCRDRSCSVGRATARRTAAPKRCHSRHADHLHAARRGPCSATSV